MSTLAALQLLLARDAAPPSLAAGCDAAAWDQLARTIAAWDARPLAYAAIRSAPPPSPSAPTLTAGARLSASPSARLAERVPPALLAAWRTDHTQTTAVNLRLAFEVERLLAALRRAGAHVAPLKGMALFTLGAYRDPGARPTSDIDLVIDPAHAALVDRVLHAHGFDQARVGGPKHLPPYQRGNLLVEVHEHAFWSLADGHRVRVAEMLDPHGAPHLGATVAHLLHHLFESSVTTPWLIVKTLIDLAEIRAFCASSAPASASDSAASTSAPASAAFADPALSVALAARHFGLSRRLGALAGLLARALDQPVPAPWLRDTRPADVTALLARCAPRSPLLDQALRLPDRLAAFARMPLSEKTALLHYHLLPPPASLRALYGLPPGSHWVWPLYPLRPAHLLARSAMDAARLARRRRG